MSDPTKKRNNLLSVSTLLKLPGQLGTLRTFADAINLKSAESDVQSELKRPIVIVGLANTGKSTLFNKIQGRYRSEVSSVAGTTLGPVEGKFGPFLLIDTPGHLPQVQEDHARNAAVILMLIDGTKQVSKDDIMLYTRLQQLKRPIIVAVNKCDAVKIDPEVLARNVGTALGVTGVIPISGKVGTNVAEDLMPSLIEASPEAALLIGRQLPAFRRAAGARLIRNAALVSLAAGMEPIPLIDLPIILGNQVRMVLRLAAIYGEPLSGQNIRELVAAIAGGLAMRYVAEEVAKVVPVGGDLVSGAIAAGGTWAIGWVALEYFESGKKIDSNQLRQLFHQLYSSFRTSTKPEDAIKQIPSSSDLHLK